MLKLGWFIGFVKNPKFKVVNNKNTSLSTGVFSVLSIYHSAIQADIVISTNQSVLFNAQLERVHDHVSSCPGIYSSKNYLFPFSKISSFLKLLHSFEYALPSIVLSASESLIAFVLISLLEKVKGFDVKSEIFESCDRLVMIDDSSTWFLYHA
ncbi:MAG: hypothetical protein OQK82_00230 [Candidatus Pacearchaeota archaeon]|nr:hypothetical protein [Candidatus Pacearchaeota archaeon]